MFSELKIERQSRSMIVRFTRSEIRNPLSVTVLDQLTVVLDNVSDDIDALIFTGTGNVFASGANLREIALVTGDASREFALRGQDLMNRIADSPKTTIAAINGYCFGGALDLALACKRRIASPTASFSHPGTGLGIITGWGGTQRLPRLIGQAKAMEMFFTAESIDAAEGLRIGLIDEISSNPLETAIESVSN